jgi:hypothetical protein
MHELWPIAAATSSLDGTNFTKAGNLSLRPLL